MSEEFSEGRFRSQDGTGLYFREYGAPTSGRPTILCLTGLARNSRDYHRTALRLRKAGHHVIAPDYRGRGRSDYCMDPMRYTPPVYLDDIRHLLTVKNIHKVVVLGTSLGGLLGMGMGAALPSTLSGVILNDVGPDIQTSGLDRIIGYLSQSPAFKDWEEAHAHIRKLFPQAGYEAEEDWRRLTRNSCRETKTGTITYDWDPNIVIALQKKAPMPDLWKLFATLRRIPLLAFRGAKSDILTGETFARMMDAHPAMKAVTIPGVGHVPSLEEKEALEALDEFLHPFRS